MGSHQMYESGGQLNAEVSYGLPVGARFVGTPRVGLATSQYGREYQGGYAFWVLSQGRVHSELGVDAQWRQSPGARRSEQRVAGPGDARMVGGLRRSGPRMPRPSLHGQLRVPGRRTPR